MLDFDPLDFTPPTKKPRVKKFIAPTFCRDCAVELSKKQRHNKRCPMCNDTFRKSSQRLEKPRLLLPCPWCGELRDVTRRGRPTLCATCVKPARREAVKIKYAQDEEFRNKVKAHCTAYDRARGIQPKKIRTTETLIMRKINHNISKSVSDKLRGSNKSGWRDELGWTIQELKAHLEKQFRFGMSWKNYGEWQIDHIKPRSLFSFTTHADPEFKECWALSNLQPLWATENATKGNQYPCPYHGRDLF